MGDSTVSMIFSAAAGALGFSGASESPTPLTNAQRAQDRAQGIQEAIDILHDNNGIVTTGPGQHVNVRFEDGATMQIEPSSTIDLKQLSPEALEQTHQIKFGSEPSGKLQVKSGVIETEKPNAQHVRTPAALLGARG